MNRHELVRTLRDARIPDALYDIPGVHDIPMRPDSYYYLRLEAGDWVVGVADRAENSELRRFTAEDAACRYLYDRLRELPSEAAPDAAERIAETIAQRDEIQRQAWAAFDRALRDHTGRGWAGEPPDQP